MKKSLVSIMAIAAMAFAGIASAQQTGYYAQNSGRVQNTVEAYAAVNGNGGSMSVAEGSSQAVANGSVHNAPGVVNVTGDVAGFNKAVAYNTSFGNGVGSALSTGWSDATTTGHSTSVLPYGNVTVSGTVDGGMHNPVRNGTDVKVQATTSQDGFVNADYKGGFAVNGHIAQTNGGGTTYLAGGVGSTQYSGGEVVAGGVTFNGGTPAGQAAAVRFGNSGVTVNVGGSFVDPVAGN